MTATETETTAPPLMRVRGSQCPARELKPGMILARPAGRIRYLDRKVGTSFGNEVWMCTWYTAGGEPRPVVAHLRSDTMVDVLVIVAEALPACSYCGVEGTTGDGGTLEQFNPAGNVACRDTAGCSARMAGDAG
jgi:hypothetical protein